ncbi:MAG: hypothetical protein IKK75_13890 [Clostridia bacterium]|nr:hypothetical protein [Clostridia bacterium]
MNPFVIVLAALGLVCILFFIFCFGAAYLAQQVQDAAEAGKPCRLPGGLIVRVEPWNGGHP